MVKLFFILILVVSQIKADEITYKWENYPLDQIDGRTGVMDVISGEIVTNGRIGQLFNSDIVSWQFTLQGNDGEVGPFYGNGSSSWGGVYGIGDVSFAGLTATPNQLILSPNGSLSFEDILSNYQDSQKQSQVELGYFPNRNPPIYWAGYYPNNTYNEPVWLTENPIMRGGDWVIAQAPEPNTLVFLIIGSISLIFIRLLNELRLR